MSALFHDTFTGTNGTDLGSHTPEVGSWTVVAGTGTVKIFNNRACGDGSNASQTYRTQSLGVGEYDITIPVHQVADAGLHEKIYVLARYAPGNASQPNGYCFALGENGSHVRILGTGITEFDGGLVNWVDGVGSTIALGNNSDHTIVIKIRDAIKEVYLNGVLQRSFSDNRITHQSGTNDYVAINPSVTFGSSWDLQLDEMTIETPTSPLEAPTVSVINSALAGWDGSATSVAPTAAGVYCPTPSAGTPSYTYQWHVSTTGGFTPSGGTAASGATSQIQLLTGLTPGTTYYIKCVVSDAAPSSVTTNQVTFSTPSATPAGASVSTLIGDSTGAATASAMVTAINTDRGRSDTVIQPCTSSGKSTIHYLPANSNNWLKFVAIVAKAWGGPVNFCLGINDANVGTDPTTATNANILNIFNYLVGEGINVVTHYILFNNNGGSSGTQVNGWIDTINAYMLSLVNGTSILAGDKQAKNYFSQHTNLFADSLHPNDFAPLGKFRGRALCWRTGKITPTLSLSVSFLVASSTGNVITVTGNYTGWNDGTPGNPGLTVSAGSITAQTLPAFNGDGSLTITAPASGTVNVTDLDSGASATYTASDADSSSSSSASSLSSASSASSNSSSSLSSGSSTSSNSSSSPSTASSASNQSSGSSSSAEPEAPNLHQNPARNTYPSVLINDDDPGMVVKIGEMAYRYLNVPVLHAPVTLDLHSEYANSEIRYTLSGKEPTSTSYKYVGPLVFTRNMSGENTVVRARIYDKRNTNVRGKVIRVEFRVLP